MKVLALTNLFPSLREPTRGTFNLQAFSALAQFSEVRVVSPRVWWSYASRPMDLVRVPSQSIAGLEVAYPAYGTLPRIGLRFNGPALYFALKRRIAQIYREFPFDAILAAWVYPDAFAAARLAEDYRCPIITCLMGSDINDLASRPQLLPHIRWTLERSDRVIAVSEALRDKVLEMGVSPDRIVVQRNAVDGDLFNIRPQSDARNRLGLPLNRKLIVYIGNIRPVKGSDVLIEAMTIIASRLPDTDLLMVGSGELETALRARVETLGLKDRVRFCGRQGHATIPDWMSASDVFCLPSRNEGCPNVILEALASGRPVVASKVGGIPEILDDSCGILVPPESPESLANGLEACLNQDWNPERLRSSIQFLSWREVAQSYYQVICEAQAATPTKKK